MFGKKTTMLESYEGAENDLELLQLKQYFENLKMFGNMGTCWVSVTWSSLATTTQIALYSKNRSALNASATARNRDAGSDSFSSESISSRYQHTSLRQESVDLINCIANPDVCFPRPCAISPPLLSSPLLPRLSSPPSPLLSSTPLHCTPLALQSTPPLSSLLYSIPLHFTPPTRTQHYSTM